MAYVLGLDAKLYRNTATWGSPSWDEFTNVKDVKLGLQKAEADTTTRGGNGWRSKTGTLKEGSIEFTMVWDPGGTDFEAVKNAFFNDTLLDLAILDGAYASGNGLRAEFSVLDFTRDEPLEDVLTATVKLGIGYSSNTPEWWTNGS